MANNDTGINERYQWYYRKQGGDRYFEFGPFTWEKIFVMYMKGELAGDTEVRCSEFPWAPLTAFLPGRRFNVKIQAATALHLLRSGFQRLADRRHRERNLMIVALCLIALYFVVHNVIFPRPKPVTFPQTQELFPGSSSAPGRSASFKTRPSAGTHPLQEDLTSSEVLRLTNVTRSEHGIPELKESFLLNAVAVDRARDMFEKQYFDHVSPTGEKAADIAQKVGYRYKMIGENIAAGAFITNQKIINGWMQSPGHRKNLLSGQFEEIGVAVVKGRLEGDETWIAVQVFGRQSPAVREEK